MRKAQSGETTSYQPAKSLNDISALACEKSIGSFRCCESCGKSAIVSVTGGKSMAMKNKLRDAAVTIGSAAGKLDGKTRKAAQTAAHAVQIAEDELEDLTKQINALKKQLKKSTKRIKSAFR
jgi:hypothetical protein